MNNICLNCKKSFIDKWHKNKKKKFCSQKCYRRNKTKSKTQIIECFTCKTKIRRPNCHINKINFCSMKCQGIWQSQYKTRENSSKWISGATRQNGYKFNLIGNSQYRAEHRLIVEKEIGRKLTKTEIIHHIDGNKTNNEVNNLFLCSNLSEHRKIHIQIESLVYQLLKIGWINFDRKTKTYMPTHKQARNFGVRYAKVEVINGQRNRVD